MRGRRLVADSSWRGDQLIWHRSACSRCPRVGLTVGGEHDSDGQQHGKGNVPAQRRNRRLTRAENRGNKAAEKGERRLSQLESAVWLASRRF